MATLCATAVLGVIASLPVSAAPTGVSVVGTVAAVDPRTGVLAVAVGGPAPNVVLVRAGEARVTGAASLDAVADGAKVQVDATSETVDGIEVRTASAVRISAPNPSAKPKSPDVSEEERD